MSASAPKKRASAEAVADLRNTLDWLRTEGDLIETDVEVDPDLEVVGLQKHTCLSVTLRPRRYMFSICSV